MNTVSTNRGDDAIGLLLIILLEVQGHGIIEPDLVVLRRIIDDPCEAKNPLQIIDTAVIFTIGLLRSIILEVFRAVPLRGCLRDFLRDLRTEHQLSMVDLGLDLLDVRLRKLLSHHLPS